MNQFVRYQIKLGKKHKHNLIRTIATLPKPVIEVTHPDNQTSKSTLDTIDRLEKYTIGIYKRPSIVFEYGKGCYLYDSNNRPYLDFMAGVSVNALGYADSAVTQDLSEQSKRLIHINDTIYNTNASLLAEKIVKMTNTYAHQAWASKIILCDSGTEANEGALKIARKWGKAVGGEKKTQLICFRHGFHGRSLGALSVSSSEKSHNLYAPLLPNVHVLDFNNQYEAVYCVNENTAGVIVEPIQSEGGVHVAEQEFLNSLRKRCDQTQSLLIYDETQCGLGRTGKMWAHEHYDKSCTPDILTMAKPLANGVPIGALMATEKVADALKNDHETTFNGNPLAFAVALGVVDRITNEKFLKQVMERGYALKRDLNALRDEYPYVIKEIRGNGLLLGVEFFNNPKELLKLSRERGLLVASADNNTIRIIPPLILTKDEAREGISRFSGAIHNFAKHS